jgi:hypothetical protein
MPFIPRQPIRQNRCPRKRSTPSFDGAADVAKGMPAAGLETLRRPVHNLLMTTTDPFTFMIEKAPVGANGVYWIIFRNYREIQRSRETFATKREAEVDAKATILSLLEKLPDARR